MPGYSDVDEGICNPIENCPTGCDTCKDATPINTETAVKVCVTCAVGYTFDNGNTMIEDGKECVPCTVGCNVCTVAVKSCSACSGKYKKNEEGSGCVETDTFDGAIIGIIIGVIVIVGIAGALIWYFIFYQKGSTVS